MSSPFERYLERIQVERWIAGHELGILLVRHHPIPHVNKWTTHQNWTLQMTTNLIHFLDSMAVAADHLAKEHRERADSDGAAKQFDIKCRHLCELIEGGAASVQIDRTCHRGFVSVFVPETRGSHHMPMWMLSAAAAKLIESNFRRSA